MLLGERPLMIYSIHFWPWSSGFSQCVLLIRLLIIIWARYTLVSYPSVKKVARHIIVEIIEYLLNSSLQQNYHKKSRPAILVLWHSMRAKSLRGGKSLLMFCSHCKRCCREFMKAHGECKFKCVQTFSAGRLGNLSSTNHDCSHSLYTIPIARRHWLFYCTSLNCSLEA